MKDTSARTPTCRKCGKILTLSEYEVCGKCYTNMNSKSQIDVDRRQYIATHN